MKKYTIEEQADGNYIGTTQRNGEPIEVRQGDPHTVLTMLITHE